jgi:integrase
MGTIRERGGRFHVQVRMSGFPARTSSFPNRRLAERWVKKIEGEMVEGRHFTNVEARRRTVSEAIDKYILEELPKLRGCKGRKIQLTWWKQRLGARKIADVSSALISDCKNELVSDTYTRAKLTSKRSVFRKEGVAPTYKRSGATVDRYLAALAVVFSTAKREWQWTHNNPFESVSKFGGKKRVRHLVGDEQQRLLAATAADPQLHTMVILALATTPRAGELTILEWPDVDLETGLTLLRLTKNGDPRAAWIHGEALRLLKEHHERYGKPSDGAVFKSVTGKLYRYDKPFKAALSAAGIKNFRFHDLRHSSATYLAREGATEQQLKAIGGWKSNVVSRYVHLAAEDAKAVVQKMNEKILGGKEAEVSTK